MVLDASVWVAALIKKEQHHAESALFLSRLVQDRRTASVPILVLAEVAGAIARQSRDTARAETGLRFMRTQGWLSIHPVTESQGETAAAIAARQFLHGADGVYAALARQLGTPSRDLGQRIARARCCRGTHVDSRRLVAPEPR